MKPVATSAGRQQDPGLSGQRLIESWEQINSGSWDTQAVPELFDCARALSQPASSQSGRDVAGVAGDLEAYLSAFVDSGLVPNEQQRQRVAEMVDAVSNCLDLDQQKPAAPQTVRVASRPSRPGRIWTLLRLDNPIPDLLPLLRICGFDARRFDSLEEVNEALEGNPPGVILLDSQYLPAVPRLRERLDPAVTQIALMSTERDPFQRMTCVQQGVDVCFQPPLHTCEIALDLSRLIHGDNDHAAQIVVADPDRTEASFVASLLTTRGLKVKVEHDLQETFDEVAGHPPDLLLLSTAFSQPTELILGTLRQERQLKTMPVIMLDAENHGRGGALNLVKAGADDVLTTPVVANKLLETVAVRLERAKQLAPRGRQLTVRNLLYQIAVITSEAKVSDKALMVMRISPESPLDSAAAEVLDSQAEMMLTLFAGCDRPLKLDQHKLAALIEGDDQGGLDARLHRLIRAFENQRFLVADHMISANVYIGVCPLRGHSGSPEQTIDIADRLSLNCEESGESGVRTATDSGNMPLGCEGVVDAVLSSGLNHRNSVLRFYPLLDDEFQASGLYLASLSLHVRGTLRPRFDWHEYMPYLEKTDRAITLDQFLFQRVLDTLVADRWDGPSPTVLLPLSGSSFADPSFPTWVATKLKHSGIPPSCMVLSFDTSGLVDAALEAPEKLRELHQLGLRAGICGFGTDMVAIELIRRLPLSCVIFDRAFAQWVGRSDEVDATMQLLLKKLDSCDALTVGVSIDDERARERLHGLGLDLLSGDAVAPPMGRPVN